MASRRKGTKSVMLAGGVLALAAAGLVAVWRLPPRVPFDLTPVSVTPADAAVQAKGISGFNVVRMTLRMHDGKKHPLQVMREAAIARLENQWVEIPDATFADEEDEEDSNRVNRLVFFPVSKGADACRVEVTYRVYPPARMAWLRNAWDAYHAKSTRGKTVKRVDDSMLTRVFDWLCPDPRQPRFKTATVKVNLADHSVAVTVRDIARGAW